MVTCEVHVPLATWEVLERALLWGISSVFGLEHPEGKKRAGLEAENKESHEDVRYAPCLKDRLTFDSGIILPRLLSLGLLTLPSLLVKRYMISPDPSVQEAYDVHPHFGQTSVSSHATFHLWRISPSVRIAPARQSSHVVGLSRTATD